MWRGVCPRRVCVRRARPAVPDIADARRAGAKQTAVEQRAAGSRLLQTLALEAHAAAVPGAGLRSFSKLLLLREPRDRKTPQVVLTLTF